MVIPFNSRMCLMIRGRTDFVSRINRKVKKTTGRIHLPTHLFTDIERLHLINSDGGRSPLPPAAQGSFLARLPPVGRLAPRFTFILACNNISQKKTDGRVSLVPDV